MTEVPRRSIDGKDMYKEWRETVEILHVPISLEDFKILWADEYKYRARLWRMRRHGA